MSESQNLAPSTGLRIPKACENCRTRKIKCNGANPCKTCQQRDIPCIYRDVIRQRRKKQHQERHSEDSQTLLRVGVTSENSARQHCSPGPSQQSGRPKQSVLCTFPNSVSATHMASPSCKVQLYYGPTSHFSLMQHIYRDLVSTPQLAQSEPQGEVEEAGAGLDLFSFRRIFFGTPVGVRDPAGGSSVADGIAMFLPFGLAKTFLQRFLSTLYNLTPFRPKKDFESLLEQLYDPNLSLRADTLNRLLILLSLACGALGTEHCAWGDVLFEEVKASSTTLDDVVNLQTVQLSLLMISLLFLASTWSGH